MIINPHKVINGTKLTMGGCYSKNKKLKKKKQSTTEVNLRPFFRQSSVESIHSSNNEVWTKRESSDNPPVDEPAVFKETVLHRNWWQDPTFKATGVDEYSDCSDVYDTIDDDKMIKNEIDAKNFIMAGRPTWPLPKRPLPKPPTAGILSLSKARNCVTGPRMTSATGTDDVYELYDDTCYVTNTESEVPKHSQPVLEDDEEYEYNTYGAPEDTMKSHSAENGSTDKKQMPRLDRLPPPPRPAPGSRNRPKSVPKVFQMNSSHETEREITHEQSECMKCSEMVQIFKPLLVQNLLIHDILPHLHFLDNHDDLYEEMKNSSEKNAIVSLLDGLDRSEELGKWEKFMDVLNTCGYSFIVDNIRGYTFINHEYQKKYIKEIAPIIGKVISPPEIMPFLMAYDLISDTDRDNILCECNNRGDYAGAILLLDRIPRKHKDWYIVFIQALEEAGLDDVATSLKIEKLMDNGRTKDSDGYEMFNQINENTSPRRREPAPPLIPPRIPIKEKRVVQIPVMVDETFIDESNADEEEDSKFGDLKEEINKLEQEERELDVETSLLEKKSDCFKKIIEHKKRKGQIQEEISLLEKENMAIDQEPVLYDESQEEQSYIDAYYPGGYKLPGLMIMKGILDSKGVDEELIPSLQNAADVVSPVPLYSLRFDKIRCIIHSDKDSGIGKVDENLDDEYEYCGQTTNNGTRQTNNGTSS